MFLLLGLYKDDIAQVDYVDLAQNQVHLKLLPRVDYTRPRGALRNNQVSFHIIHLHWAQIEKLRFWSHSGGLNRLF